MAITVPTIDIIQFDNAVDPSGTRDLGATADGFVKFLDTSSSGHLDFGYMNITESGVLAGTNLLVFRPTTFGSAQEVYNFRFHLQSITSWGVGTYSFLWKKNIHFESGVTLSLADESVPTSLPSSGNILSTASGTYIQAIAESGVSQYTYLDIFTGTDVTVGTYGGPGQGGFRFRLTYDFV